MALSDNVADKVWVMGGPAIDLALILLQIINYVPVLFSMENIFFSIHANLIPSERKFSKKEKTNEPFGLKCFFFLLRKTFVSMVFTTGIP